MVQELQKNLDKKRKGKIGENIALFFIYANGGILKDLNWTCRWGEIDLIFYDKKGIFSCLVFCEVKYRTSNDFGFPTESIDHRKLVSQKRAIRNYLHMKGLENTNWRFDVISVLNTGEDMNIKHYKYASEFN